MRQVAVLGATGSIGESTLDVIARHPDRYRATVLAAHRSVDEMASLCRVHQPLHAVMSDPDAAAALADRLSDLPTVQVVSGAEALDDLRRQVGRAYAHRAAREHVLHQRARRRARRE